MMEFSEPVQTSCLVLILVLTDSVLMFTLLMIIYQTCQCWDFADAQTVIARTFSQYRLGKNIVTCDFIVGVSEEI